MLSLLNKFILTLCLSIISISPLIGNETSWNGKWHAYWANGAFVVHLEQHGSEVNGTYSPSQGTFKGTAEENVLTAIRTDKDGTQRPMILTLSDSGKSFFGNSKISGWITGIRVNENSKFNAISLDQSSPLKAFYSFLALGNAARAGNYEILEKMMNIIHFSEAQNKLRHGAKLDLIQKLFDIINECHVKRLDFFTKDNKEDNAITLHQLGTDISIPIHFIQDAKDKKWMIQLSEKKILRTKLQSLLSARKKYEIDPHSNLELATPRDTIRTFYEQYDRWEDGGKEYVISTLNLSHVDPSIHEWQAPLLAYYLKSILDRISTVVFQEIPNDPKSKKPYVHYHHPIGNIVIRPYTIDGQTKWKFSPQTLLAIDALYYETTNMKILSKTKQIEENAFYFTLKNTAHDISPMLLKKFKYTEVWQLILLLVIIILGLFVSYIIYSGIMQLFHKFYITKRWSKEKVTLEYIRPIQVSIFAIILLYGAHQLGLEDVIFSFIKAFTQLIMILSLTWVIYNLITILFSILLIEAKKTSTNVDEIILSLTSSILRILLIITALFMIAEVFGIAYKTVLAGLGIGGLAFAIASKDTIANFFGSAIIIADRPFKTGDKIKIGSDIGVIIDVGIRSTKIRTIHNTVLIIPNNKITQETIDNYSKRDAMRINTEFYFALDTPEESLDTLDSQLANYLEGHKDVDTTKVMLTGVNDFTKHGISFGVTFFVLATTETAYSDIRHHMMTEISKLIKKNAIKMVMIHQEEINEIHKS